MNAMFRDDAQITFDADGVEVREGPLGAGFKVLFVRVRAGADLAPGRSRSHVAYILRGQLRVSHATGTETHEAGQAVRLPLGVATHAVEECEFVAFCADPEVEYSRDEAVTVGA